MSTILENHSETVAHTPGRASSIGLWILHVVLAAITAGGGALEVAGGVGVLIPDLAGLASDGSAAC